MSLIDQIQMSKLLIPKISQPVKHTIYLLFHPINLLNISSLIQKLQKEKNHQIGEKEVNASLLQTRQKSRKLNGRKTRKNAIRKRKKLFDVNIEAESSDEEEAELILDDDSDDSVEENVVNIIDEPINREPDEDEFILVKFGGNVHYVAKVIKKQHWRGF